MDEQTKRDIEWANTHRCPKSHDIKLRLAGWYAIGYQILYYPEVVSNSHYSTSYKQDAAKGFDWKSIVKYGVQFLAEALGKKKEEFYEKAGLERRPSGWGYSSFFFAYPEKVIGTMKATGSFMFPVTVEGTREDVINYFERKFEEDEEFKKKHEEELNSTAKERGIRLRIAIARAKALKLSLALSKYYEGLEGANCGSVIAKFVPIALAFIRDSLRDGSYCDNLDCSVLLTPSAQSMIYEHKEWFLEKLTFSSNCIRHIRNNHRDAFPHINSYKKIIEVIADPDDVLEEKCKYDSVVLVKQFGEYRLAVVLKLKSPKSYNPNKACDLYLKTGYDVYEKGNVKQKGEELGYQDDCSLPPLGNVQNATQIPLFAFEAKIVDIRII